jgi:HlyD family secretion protein
VSQFRLSKNDIDILFSGLSKAISSTPIKSNHSLNEFNTIQLKDISFKYNGIIILDSINLTINKNDFVGIIGESGSGKTSLLNIILGLVKPDSGSILFNGENLNEIDSSVYQKQFGMVCQDIFLPNGSLAKSICFEDLNELNANNLKASINKVNLESFLNSQKLGFNTDIGENGAFLSGGQKQKVALARSFYFNRSILILDEPTSSLDSKAQDDIFTSLEVLLKSKTIILVTHNKKLLRNCTKVYEIIDSKLLDISNSSHF